MKHQMSIQPSANKMIILHMDIPIGPPSEYESRLRLQITPLYIVYKRAGYESEGFNPRKNLLQATTTVLLSFRIH